MKKATTPIILIIVLLFSSCSFLDSSGNSSLNGSSWTLVSYHNQSLIPGTAMTAAFEQNEVSGSASCNHYFGSYSTRDEQIEIEGLGWTEMACMDPEGIMEQEQEIMKILAKAKSYQVLENELVIHSLEGESLVFARIDGSD